jgi:hypothetical protein
MFMHRQRKVRTSASAAVETNLKMRIEGVGAASWLLSG